MGQSLEWRPHSPQPNKETAGHAFSIVLLVEEAESAVLPAGPEEDCGMTKSQNRVLFPSHCGAGTEGSAGENPPTASCWDLKASLLSSQALRPGADSYPNV